ncbi:MAG: sodium-dependent transporter [Gammaproteobacteria bacterium]
MLKTSIHGVWSSGLLFVFAAVGSAIGLGNIWKFPYIAGEYGGGAFVLMYVVFVFLIGMPIMMAEIMLGRRGRQSPVNTMYTLAIEAGKSPAWQALGWMGMVAGFLILSYYSVVAGEVMAYSLRAISGAFTHQTPSGIRSIYSDFVSDPENLLAWHTIFVVLTMVVVARGVREGLEKLVRILMPLLFLLLIVLVGYGLNSEGFAEAVRFLFQPDFAKLIYTVNESGVRELTAKPILVAMGHSFFTLSLGMGAIMPYGAYLGRTVSISHATLSIVLLDTVVALLAGLAIFPIVFTYQLDPASGPGLIFQTLPLAFGAMPGGAFFGFLFFILLFFAAWSSAISLIEPAIAWMVERRAMTRVAAAAWAGAVVWLLGIASIFSATGTTLRDILSIVLGWAGLETFGLRQPFFSLTFFEVVDFATANIMLPLGGMLTAIFVGWVMQRESVRDEINVRHGDMCTLWMTLLKYVSPLAVFIIFLSVLGLIG